MSYPYSDSYIGQLTDEVVSIGLLSSSYNVRHRDVTEVVSICNILGDSHIEQRWFLGYYADMPTEPGYVEGQDISAIDSLQYSESPYRRLRH